MPQGLSQDDRTHLPAEFRTNTVEIGNNRRKLTSSSGEVKPIVYISLATSNVPWRKEVIPIKRNYIQLLNV